MSQQQRQQSISPKVEAALTNEQLLLTMMEDKSVPASQQAQKIAAWFDQPKVIESLEHMLPGYMKGSAPRLTRRAMQTLAGKPNMADIPTFEFIRCVLEAAEFGFAVDGKMAYIVRYGKGDDEEKPKQQQGDKKEKKQKTGYSLQFDYKALIAIAKRTGQIHSIDYDVVCKNDHFKHGKIGGQSIFEHVPPHLGQPRGDVIGAFCRVWHRDGTWGYEVMDRLELDKVQAVAPAKNGPWKTWPDEMRKKTVIKRILKRYREDASLCQMMDLDDIEFEWPELEPGELPDFDAVLETTQSRTAQLAQRRQQPTRQTQGPPQNDEQELEEENLEDAGDEGAENDRREPNACDKAIAAINASQNAVAATFAHSEAMKDNSFSEAEQHTLHEVLQEKLKTFPAQETVKKSKEDRQKSLGLNG